MNLALRCILVFVVIACTVAIAYVPPKVTAQANAQLDGDGLLKDVAILRQALEALHPGLYRYNSREQINSAFSELTHQVGNGSTLRETFLALSVLTARIRCGHTYPNFFNQSDAVTAGLFTGRNRVPFYFQWIDRRMIVTRDWTTANVLPAGTEILSINGVNTSDMLRGMLPLMRADGSNDAKRVALLEVTGESRWEAFDIYAPLLYPQSSSTLTVVVRTPGGQTLPVVVGALTETEREANRLSGTKPSDAGQPLFTSRSLSGRRVLIKMPSWALFNRKWDWRSWLNRTFDDAIQKQVNGIILDLRGNEGGLDDIGREILVRLVPRRLELQASHRLVKYRSAPPDLQPFLDTWDKSFLTLGAKAIPFSTRLSNLPAGDWFKLDKENVHAGTEVIEPFQTFREKVVVLIDAQNSSATFQFAEAMQLNHLGTLVGEPTGGNKRGINGGAFFFLRLPHSGLEVDLPLIGYFPTAPQRDEGLTPDVVVFTTVSDLASGFDPQLAAATKLLQ